MEEKKIKRQYGCKTVVGRCVECGAIIHRLHGYGNAEGGTLRHWCLVKERYVVGDENVVHRI